MFILWLLWITIVFGCGFMAIGSAYVMYTQGFELALLLCFILYLGCTVYGLPRFIKLFASKG
jgi:hypothetical protein